MRPVYVLRLILLASCGLAGLSVSAQSSESQAILVLDASGSMWGQIDGRPKIAIAREAVGAMLDGWNGDALGLLTYGHRRKGDCDDIELLIEPASFDAAAIRRQVDALNPKGMTPISAAVRQAAEILRYTEQKATVILISDGEETCQADPCALGAELEAAGIDFTAHVVGFDIERNAIARQQLQCLATRTGGQYLDADDAAELNHALQAVVREPVAAAAEPPQPELDSSADIHFNDGCTAYDEENFAGESMPMGGAADSRVRETPVRWRNAIKSLSCKPGCGILVFTEPGYDGANFSIPDGSNFPRIPADYAQPFGSYEVGCSAQFEVRE